MTGKHIDDAGTQADRQDERVRHGTLAAQPTWKDGGREPIDPDDIGADGENLGKDNLKPPLRSDDN